MTKDQVQQLVRISMDVETQKLLRDNNVDLFELLAKETAVGDKLQRVSSSDFPVPPTTSGERMDPLTIVASATVIIALGSVIERILKVLTRRPVVLTNEHYEPSLDNNGEPLLDSDGKPIMSRTTTQTFEEPKDSNAPVWQAGVSASELRIALGNAAT